MTEQQQSPVVESAQTNAPVDELPEMTEAQIAAMVADYRRKLKSESKNSLIRMHMALADRYLALKFEFETYKKENSK